MEIKIICEMNACSDSDDNQYPECKCNWRQQPSVCPKKGYLLEAWNKREPALDTNVKKRIQRALTYLGTQHGYDNAIAILSDIIGKKYIFGDANKPQSPKEEK